MRILIWLLSFAPIIASSTTHADVIQVSPAGFVVSRTVDVKASAIDAYDMTTHVARWWNREHTYSGDARNLSLKAEAGGCFCEHWGHNSIEHARVILAMPSKTLRLQGSLGPLQEQAITGVLNFSFTPVPQGTQIKMTYRVQGGATDNTLEKLAPLVDQVLTEQMGRLVHALSSSTQSNPSFPR